MKKLDALIRLERFRITLPPNYSGSLAVVLEACKPGGYVHIVIEPMKRIRSTGPLSQNHRINGFTPGSPGSLFRRARRLSPWNRRRF